MLTFFIRALLFSQEVIYVALKGFSRIHEKKSVILWSYGVLLLQKKRHVIPLKINRSFISGHFLRCLVSDGAGTLILLCSPGRWFSSPLLSLPWLGAVVENSRGKHLLLKLTVDSACRVLPVSTLFVIYSLDWICFSSRIFLGNGFHCLKTKQNQQWRSKGQFNALILSLQCTHPIQLGSVMGLLHRVKIFTHFSRWMPPSEQLTLTIRPHLLLLPFFFCIIFPQYMLHCRLFFSVLLYFMV